MFNNKKIRELERKIESLERNIESLKSKCDANHRHLLRMEGQSVLARKFILEHRNILEYLVKANTVDPKSINYVDETKSYCLHTQRNSDNKQTS